MTRLLTLLLLSLLLAPSARAQAMRPAPATTGPLIQQQPPSFPANPAHTPAGAGASHGGLAAPGKALAPRSPNKRLLPPTKEPGIWAADGEPPPKGRRKVFGVEIPSGSTLEDRTVAAVCSLGLDAVLKDSPPWRRFIEALPENVRRCLAAKAFLHCAEQLSEQLRAGRLPHPAFGPTSVDPTVKRAGAMERSHCSGVELDGEQKATLDGINRRWVMLDLAPRLREPPEDT